MYGNTVMGPVPLPAIAGTPDHYAEIAEDLAERERGPAPRGLSTLNNGDDYQPGFCFSAGFVSRSPSGIGYK